MFEQLTALGGNHDGVDWRAKRAFKKQRAEFFADAAMVLGKAHLPSILRRQAESNAGTPLGQAYETILESYQNGEKLSEAFGPFLGDAERLALSGWDDAESDAALAAGFRMMSQIAGAFASVTAAVWKSVGQAATSFGLAMILLYMMKVSVYPNLEKMFPVAKWMLSARVTYFVINTMFSNLFVFVLLVGGIVGLYVWSLSNWNSSLRRRLDQGALYSWYRSYRSLQVLLAMALHMQANRGISSTVNLILERANRWESWYLEEIKLRNEKGLTGGEVFDVGYFDKQVVNRLILLSEAGSAEEAMEQIAFTSQKELLEQFRARIEKAGKFAKDIALMCGVLPLAFFFLTLGDYIVSAASGGFKGR